MKKLIFTGYDKSYAPLGSLTEPLMREYAKRHGYDFKCYRDKLLDTKDGIYWTGVCGALQAFEDGYDSAMYLDADQVVTNMDFVLTLQPHGFHVSQDWGADAVEPWQFSMCGFLAHKDVRLMLVSALAIAPDFIGKPFPEQNVIQHMAKVNLINFTLHPRGLFNNVPEEIFPGAVPEPWRPGDFCAHLTHADLERRIELFHEIRGRIA